MSHELVSPFSERDIAFTHDSVAALVRDSPEGTELSPEVLQRRTEYAQYLFNGPELPDGTHRSLKDVAKISLTDSTARLYLDYFETPEGAAQAEALNFGQGPISIMRELAVKTALAEAVPSGKVKDVATESLKWYKQKLKSSLEEELPVDEWRDSAEFNINFAPNVLLDKVEGLQRFRKFYRELGRDIHDVEGEVADEQRALLTMHMGRVNSLVAELYPNILDLTKQISLSPATPLTSRWKERLLAIAPVVRSINLEAYEESAMRRDDFLRRLDFVRNGAQHTGQPTFSAISNVDLALADELDAAVESTIRDGVERFPDDVVAGLRVETLDTQKVAQLSTNLLSNWGLLSSHRATLEEVEARSGPADDGLWQVVVTRRVDSLEVDGLKKVMLVPEKYSLNGVNGLSKIAHEGAHVLQTEADAELAKVVPLASIKGRRALMLREMGGIFHERRFKEMCGETRGTNTIYLRALQAKEAGLNQLAVAKAFQEADRDSNAKLAGDRVLRLYRKGGYDSQPLDYLEQEIALRELLSTDPRKANIITTRVASFSLKDAATLHDLGMLRIPDSQPFSPAEDVLRVYLEMYGKKVTT